MNLITVVSVALYGNERPRPRPMRSVAPAPPFSQVAYKLITNNPDKAKASGWDVEAIDQHNHLRSKAREIKSRIHHFFPNSLYWLWIDSEMQIHQDPKLLVQKYLVMHDIAALPHPHRSNYWQEGEAICSNAHLGAQRKGVQEALERYKKAGHMPIGLYETGVLLRRNTPKIREFNEIWWAEIQDRCVRDQISFTYAAWKVGLPINAFPGSNKQRHQGPPTFGYLPEWKEVTRAW